MTPYSGVTLLAAKQVCLGRVKRATCTDLLQIGKLLSTFYKSLSQQRDLLQDRFERTRW